jgi:hypothetical protein
MCFEEKGDVVPHDVIFVNGLYIEGFLDNGLRGFKICHESEYFKEKAFFHQNMKEADQWIYAV